MLANTQEVKAGAARVRSQARLNEEREGEERERKRSFPELTVSDSLRRKGSMTFFKIVINELMPLMSFRLIFKI